MCQSFICRVTILRAASFEFLLVFFILQAGISLRGEVNRIVTRLITRIVVLRLQGSRSLDLKPDRCVTSALNELSFT
jgi:hypothetical protein